MNQNTIWNYIILDDKNSIQTEGYGFFLYLAINWNNEITYIGQTIWLKSRISSHRANSERWQTHEKIYVAELTNKTTMDIYEIFLINTLIPKFNIKDKRWDICDSLMLWKISFYNLENIEFKNKIKNYKKMRKKSIKENISVEDQIESLINNNNKWLNMLKKLQKNISEIKIWTHNDWFYEFEITFLKWWVTIDETDYQSLRNIKNIFLVDKVNLWTRRIFSSSDYITENNYKKYLSIKFNFLQLQENRFESVDKNTTKKIEEINKDFITAIWINNLRKKMKCRENIACKIEGVIKCV